MNEESRAALAVLAVALIAIATLWWFTDLSRSGAPALTALAPELNSGASPAPVESLRPVATPEIVHERLATPAPRLPSPVPAASPNVASPLASTSTDTPSPEAIVNALNSAPPKSNRHAIPASPAPARRKGELDVSMTCPTSLAMSAGGVIVVHVQNGSDHDFHDVTLQNSIDAQHLDLGALPDECSRRNDWGLTKAVCDLGTLAAGASIDVTLPVLPKALGPAAAKATLLGWSNGSAQMRSTTCSLRVEGD